MKTDIVWLVKQTVTLADGSTQEVLVPQVYVHASNVEVTGQGTLIAGNDVAFQAAQDIVNSGGTIAARKGVSLAGANLQNLGGRISGADVQVAAAQDINNLGGAIDGSNSVTLAAGRDINVNSTSVNTANAVTSGTNINQVASVSGKDVVMVAGRDVTANAAVIAGTGDVSLAAGRDVSLGTVNENYRQEINWASDRGASNWVSTLTGPNLVDQSNGAHGISGGGVNRATLSASKDVVTQVSGKNISIRAGQDVVSKGAQVVAEGALNATAGRDIRIDTANESGSARDQHQHSSGGFLTATSVRTDDASSYSKQVGSTFSGNTVAVRAGNDVNVSGSDVVSTQGTALAAGNNVNIVAATDSSTQRNFRQEITSGVMGAGFGVTVGSRIQSRDVDARGQTAAASTVGSVEGNVSIVAGNRYTQVGSDVLAPKGDIDIAAKSVEIRAAEQASRTVVEDKFRQQGVTVAVTSPVLSAVQTVDQMAEAASKTKDRRMQALAGAAAGLSVSNAADAVIQGQGQTIDGKANQIVTGPADPVTGKAPTRDAKASERVGGINLAISLGASSSQSRSEQTSNTVRGSTVAAGGSVNISAQGGGADSNIVIQGSDIKAGVNATLKAANEVRLIAAQETSEQHGSNSSASGSVGVSFGTSGLLFTASASGSRGRGDGSDVTQVNTHVDAGNKLTISSGTDTTLKGAVVSGKQVVMDVGTSGKGNLNIESLQDTSTYKSNQQSLGGSVSVGMGQMSGSINYSGSRTNSNYASVMEQSGVKAGDGGFQINVRGNTDLKGAVVASSNKAVTDNKNSLTTQTLTQSDIQNTAEYDAQSVGIGLGYSTGKGNPVGRDQKGNAQTGGARVPGADLATTRNDGGFSATPPIITGASGSSSSTTKSGISGGLVTITDDKKQQELTGKTAEQTVASVNRDVSSDKDGSNSLKPIFDKNEIENRVAIATAFTRELGTFLDNRAKEADAAKTKLDAAIEEERSKPIDQRDDARLRSLADQYLDADQWSSTGDYRKYVTSIAGALTGNLTGSTSQLVQAAAVNYLQGLGAEQVKKIADSLDSGTARAALHGVVACAGAMAKDASCAAGALGASAGSVINNLLGSVDGLSNEEKEGRKNLVTSIVGGIATAAGSGDAANATLAAQLETENNALGRNTFAFVEGMRRCSGGTSSSCFEELKEKTEKQKVAFNLLLDKACQGEGATLQSCQDKIRGGQVAYPYIGLAMVYAKTDEQKAYVKQLLNEQENDLAAQFPKLEALGANASLLEHLLSELTATIDNPAGVVASLNSLRGKTLNVKSSGKSGGSALPVPEMVVARNGLSYKSNTKHTPGAGGSRFNAGTEPSNSLEIFNSSIETSKPGVRLAVDKQGNVHRFFDDNNGTYHWSGSSADMNSPLTIGDLQKSGFSKELKKLGVK
nr:hemagglutinin repeat-containing protein [Herbaspirillum rubrisubalbicans]